METKCSMMRLITILSTIILGLEISNAAQLVSTTELIGTWKIEPSTFTVSDLALPNTNPRPQPPKDHNEFALILKQDGTFATINVRDKLFFNLPARADCHGHWAIRTNSLFGTGTNSYSEFELSFEGPHSVSIGYSSPIIVSNSFTPRKPALWIGPIKDTSKTYEWSFLLTKRE